MVFPVPSEEQIQKGKNALVDILLKNTVSFNEYHSHKYIEALMNILNNNICSLSQKQLQEFITYWLNSIKNNKNQKHTEECIKYIKLVEDKEFVHNAHMTLADAMIGEIEDENVDTYDVIVSIAGFDKDEMIHKRIEYFVNKNSNNIEDLDKVLDYYKLPKKECFTRKYGQYSID